MNSLERCQTVLRHEIPDRVPVIPQDYHMAMRYSGLNHLNFHTDPVKMAEAHLKFMNDFDLDGVIIGADTVCLAEAVGCKVAYSEGQCPRHVAGCLDNYDNIKDLKVPDPYTTARMPVWIEATRILAEKIGREKLVIARADQGAFSLASMMRGMEDFLMDIAAEEDEAGIHELLKYCNACMLEFIKALQKAGAHVVTTGDSISGPQVVAPRTYMKYSLPYETEMTEACDDLGIPFAIHICGRTDPILEAWSGTGCAIMELDHKTDYRAARKVTVGKNVLLGNLDTTMMYSGATADVTEAVRLLLEETLPDGDLILSSGCLLGADTPFENIEAMNEAAKKYGVYR
jgi:MtaA/CmuA family methyltransferase